MRQLLVGLARVQFSDRPAAIAKKEDGCMAMRPMTTRNEGV